MPKWIDYIPTLGRSDANMPMTPDMVWAVHTAHVGIGTYLYGQMFWWCFAPWLLFQVYQTVQGIRGGSKPWIELSDAFADTLAFCAGIYYARQLGAGITTWEDALELLPHSIVTLLVLVSICIGRIEYERRKSI